MVSRLDVALFGSGAGGRGMACWNFFSPSYVKHQESIFWTLQVGFVSEIS